MMKSTLMGLAVLTSLSTPSYAEQSACAVFASMAETVMKLRQSDTMTMTKLRSTVDKPDLPDVFKEAFLMLVSDAFEEPRYYTMQNRKRAVAYFRDVHEVACYKNASDS